MSFHFGHGHYVGLRYYYPYRHYVSGRDYAFFYSAPISYSYVPYGFYCDAPSLYVYRHRTVVRSEEIVDYETTDNEEDLDDVLNENEGEEVEPRPAASSPTSERFLRDASAAFRKADYDEAAKMFRLAGMASPKDGGPPFALAQAALALGKDAYAARMLRMALRLNPALVRESGDIVGVYRDQAEFDRVMSELTARADDTEAGSDARFLLAAQRYFSGDPRAKADLATMADHVHGDPAIDQLNEAAQKRFKATEDFPPLDR